MHEPQTNIAPDADATSADPAVRAELCLHLALASGARGMVALTFDDGPDPATTPAVLDALAPHGLTQDEVAEHVIVGALDNFGPAQDAPERDGGPL
mgnify:CR=1 FL=1